MIRRGKRRTGKRMRGNIVFGGKVRGRESGGHSPSCSQSATGSRRFASARRPRGYMSRVNKHYIASCCLMSVTRGLVLSDRYNRKRLKYNKLRMRK